MAIYKFGFHILFSVLLEMSQTLRNLLLHITFRVAFYIFVYFTMEGGEILEEGCIADNIERKLETIVKGEAGQVFSYDCR